MRPVIGSVLRNANARVVMGFLLVVVLGSSGPVAAAKLNVTVDSRLDRRLVSPLVYGINFGSPAEFGALPFPVRRWGGNSTTRYSWQNDTHSSASDWFFINTPSSHPNPALLPDGSEADLFVTETRLAGAHTVLTVPLIGWTPKDRVKRWSYSVGRYGAQTATECTASGGAFWCAADAGNGVRASDGALLAADPLDTSMPIGPSFVVDWVSHLISRFGHAEGNGVRYYALDNEPGLWNSTHRDVHPAPLTYDELWTRTVDYAGAIKTREPQARVLGPVPWGWCEYFYSPADGCGPGPDRAAHADLPLLEWYLRQVRAHELATQVRLVDLLDIHYYPQSGGALNDDESPAVAAKRLRSLKSLYDASYVDESWVGQPVNLIPRMRALIDANAPGLGLAITEYNFGGDTGISSALAQAEALAIFGREGVDLATRWVAPAATSRVMDAFRLYLDYDGAGGQVRGMSVRATTADVNRVGAYALDDAAGRLQTLLFNKSTTPESVHVALADGFGGPVSLYRFTAASALGPVGTTTASPAGLDLLLPARSATLAVITRATTDAPPSPPTPPTLTWSVQPNPSRGESRLSWVLASPGHVRIEALDLAGRRVALIHDGEAPWGASAVAWQGRDDSGARLAPGMYRIRIHAQGVTESRWWVRVD